MFRKHSLPMWRFVWSCFYSFSFQWNVTFMIHLILCFCGIAVTIAGPEWFTMMESNITELWRRLYQLPGWDSNSCLISLVPSTHSTIVFPLQLFMQFTFKNDFNLFTLPEQALPLIAIGCVKIRLPLILQIYSWCTCQWNHLLFLNSIKTINDHKLVGCSCPFLLLVAILRLPQFCHKTETSRPSEPLSQTLPLLWN